MNSYFQDQYFKQHSLNTDVHVKLKDVELLKKEPYEQLVQSLISGAQVLDHSKSPCESDFIPDTKAVTYVMYIKMDDPKDVANWMEVAKCFRVWDLDVRGQHNSMWRLHMRGNPLFVVGVPASPYSSFKPGDVAPILLQPANQKTGSS
ncbi:PREDICTED: protein O-linked-mannose beta-1,2-N-acetylglucosaminyltransferase 1-like [Priapulus caudatus]|uniref:Protein O-linked-mannose beta-1,2-N-acetylglucosaminyltransferase 1-like n=1 Tax=Priapulus caudatus TaxID=37621 RepID=A0ABM1EN52_PRICU|nr:PREDICTED: protein O-linked-mannose beta-1,2-N-acetylglucosaminyltransferase 1-like [Priapulus caudatus]